MNVMKKPRFNLVLTLFWAATLGLILTACFGHAAGNVVGWGDNSDGQATVPSGLSNAVAIAAGTWHSLALTSESLVVGWGYNRPPTSLSGLSKVMAIATGYSHNLALTAAGTVVG